MHVYNRGNRKEPIVLDSKDRWRFLQMLRYFNDEYSPPNVFRTLRELWKSDFYKRLDWPVGWPEHRPLVKILVFALMENHFHLLLREIHKGGITMFMRKLGTGMTNYFNTKYEETGRLFQGAYKAKIVDEAKYLDYVSVYIQVKNPFELYPGGLERALQEFNKGFEWAIRYPYCSLADYAAGRNSPIIDKDLFVGTSSDPNEYREFAKDCMLHMNLDERLAKLKFDD